MVFSKSLLSLGDGRVISAKAKEDGVEMLIKIDGAIIKKTLSADRKRTGSAKIVSYADECLFAGNGMLERTGNAVSFVKPQ